MCHQVVAHRIAKTKRLEPSSTFSHQTGHQTFTSQRLRQGLMQNAIAFPAAQYHPFRTGRHDHGVRPVAHMIHRSATRPPSHPFSIRNVTLSLCQITKIPDARPHPLPRIHPQRRPLHGLEQPLIHSHRLRSRPRHLVPPPIKMLKNHSASYPTHLFNQSRIQHLPSFRWSNAKAQSPPRKANFQNPGLLGILAFPIKFITRPLRHRNPICILLPLCFSSPT